MIMEHVFLSSIGVVAVSILLNMGAWAICVVKGYQRYEDRARVFVWAAIVAYLAGFLIVFESMSLLSDTKLFEGQLVQQFTILAERLATVFIAPYAITLFLALVSRSFRAISPIMDVVRRGYDPAATGTGSGRVL